MFMDKMYNGRTEIYPYYTTFNQQLLFIPVSFCSCYFLTVTFYPVTFYPSHNMVDYITGLIVDLILSAI